MVTNDDMHSILIIFHKYGFHDLINIYEKWTETEMWQLQMEYG